MCRSSTPREARFTVAALIALGRLDEAGAELAAGLFVARARKLEYELSLLLALTQELSFVVPTGSDEPPLVESDRLLTQLGVVDRPLVVSARSRRSRRRHRVISSADAHFQSGSPWP